MKLLCRVLSQSKRGFGYLEDKTILNVTYRPVIEISPHGHFAIETGSYLKITCNIHANPKTIMFYWSWKNLYQGQENPIELVNATEKDSGIYVCNSGNILGLGVAQNTTIVILFGPINSHPLVVEAKEGSNFRLSCGVSAKPEAQTFWRKYDDPSFRINGTELQIQAVTKTDASLHYCESHNVLRLSVLGSNSENLKERVTRTNLSLIVMEKSPRGDVSNHMGKNSSDCSDSLPILSGRRIMPIIVILCTCLPLLIFWLLKLQAKMTNTSDESLGPDERNPSTHQIEKVEEEIPVQHRLRRYKCRLGRQFCPLKVQPAVV